MSPQQPVANQGNQHYTKSLIATNRRMVKSLAHLLNCQTRTDSDIVIMRRPKGRRDNL